MRRQDWKDLIISCLIIGVYLLILIDPFVGIFLWYERGPNPDKHDQKVIHLLADLHYEHEQMCKCILCSSMFRECSSTDPILFERDKLRDRLNLTDEEISYFEDHPRHHRSKLLTNDWECVMEQDTCGNPVDDWDLDYYLCR